MRRPIDRDAERESDTRTDLPPDEPDQLASARGVVVWVLISTVAAGLLVWLLAG